MSKTIKLWSPQEIEYLKELIYDGFSYDKIAKILNRSKCSITYKIHALQLIKNHIWSNDDINILIDLVNKGIKYKDIAKILKRTLCAILKKSHQLQLYSIRNKCPTCHKKKYSLANICIQCGFKFDDNILSFGEEYPDLLKQWDYTKNTINPFYITKGYSKKVWWLDDKNHSWKMTVHKRTSRGDGCPVCKESHLEKQTSMILDQFNIQYIRQKKFDGCKYKRSLFFDFYIPSLNICIECQGIQHYRKKYRANKNRYLNCLTDEELLQIVHRDKIKVDYCKLNNIKLLTIPYWEIKNIKDIIHGIINE